MLLLPLSLLPAQALHHAQQHPGGVQLPAQQHLAAQPVLGGAPHVEGGAVAIGAQLNLVDLRLHHPIHLQLHAEGVGRLHAGEEHVGHTVRHPQVSDLSSRSAAPHQLGIMGVLGQLPDPPPGLPFVHPVLVLPGLTAARGPTMCVLPILQALIHIIACRMHRLQLPAHAARLGTLLVHVLRLLLMTVIGLLIMHVGCCSLVRLAPTKCA
mmetsp:Transcript_36325/g.80838  ORF Transcript_36325/g.80838 Transcript_36325/m.80838 type:complete len:210 (-) Transcript_36325:939-1568(-)